MLHSGLSSASPRMFACCRGALYTGGSKENKKKRYWTLLGGVAGRHTGGLGLLGLSLPRCLIFWGLGFGPGSPRLMTAEKFDRKMTSEKSRRVSPHLIPTHKSASVSRARALPFPPHRCLQLPHCRPPFPTQRQLLSLISPLGLTRLLLSSSLVLSRRKKAVLDFLLLNTPRVKYGQYCHVKDIVL